MFNGEGVASAKRKVHESSDFEHVPDLTVRPSKSERKKWTRNKEGKMPFGT